VRTLRRSIAVPTLLVTGVVGAALAYLAWESARQSRSLERDTDAVRSATALAFALTHAAQEEKEWMALLPSRPTEAHAALITDADVAVRELLAEIDALPLGRSSRAAAAWRQLVEARGALLALRDATLAASRAGDGLEMLRSLEKWRMMSARADALLKNFTAYHLRLLDRTVAELQRRRTRALVTASAAVLLGLLLSTAFSLALARTVVRPIVAMARAAERITATGPPAPVGGADRRDEIGVLARSFDAMTRRLLAANAGLASAVRARDEFISIASHELKTPITPLQLRVQQLLRLVRSGAGEPLSREQIGSATRNLERHVARLGKLVDNMLDVSRITSGRLSLHVEEASALDLVRDALDRVSDDLSAAGCDVRIECERDVWIPVDRARVEQVLVNVLGNAAKYAPGSAVVVRISGDFRGALLEVEDDGPGIPPAEHERIFTRFERAVPDPRQISGLGLGLFIAREIARAHGGEISVRSGRREGAAFRIQLPREPPGLTPCAPGAPSARSPVPAPSGEAG
jgi:signal transduction histidine kinase